MKIGYTTAPESYDWFGTKTIQEKVAIYCSKDVRKVEMQDDHADSQISRYLSGMYLAMSKEEFEEFADTLCEKA